MAYDALLLLAILFVATFIFLAIFGSAVHTPKHYLLQLWLLVVAGSYFIWLWTHGGQTLAMKTWRIRLVAEDGSPIERRAALMRYLIAVPSVLSGIGIVWALFDRDGLFLHDRISHTRLIRAE